MWLALSTADEESGCMKMVPGSHLQGKLDHQDTVDPNNVLHRGQTVAGVVEEQAIACTLKPGEASFHDSWTLHASQPNKSSDRRIGLNVQYMTPDMKQTVNPHETSLLVRGQDHFYYYQPEILSAEDFSAEAMASHAELDRLRKLTWEQAS